MKCPSCGAGIPDEATRCEFCRSPVSRPSTARGDAARPEKYHVEDDDRELRIWWRWFHPAVFFLIPFAIAWNAFLFGWYSMAAGFGGEMMPGPMRFVFLIFPIGHVAVGVGLIYTILTMLFNRSVIQLDGEQLSIWHGPIYYPGRTLDAHRIDQIFVAPVMAKSDDSTTTRYEVRARLKDASTRTLLAHLERIDEALYLEQALERRLKIADVTVTGEVPRV